MSKEIMDLLLKHERAISKLYSMCAEQFPELSSFWDQLADEEKKHAAVLEKLLEKVDDHTLYLNDARFKIRPLEISLEYAEEVTGQVEKGNVNLIRALSIAHSIEDSLFESRYFEIFKGESAFLNQHLKQLQDEAADHRDRVKVMLDKARRGDELV
ncbi:MAG: ferritin family protein [Bacillota bacterium]